MENFHLIKSLGNEINPKLLFINYKDLTGTKWENELNKVNFNIFYYICKGEGQVNVGGKDYFPIEGDLVFLPINQYHFSKSINDNHYAKYWCYFTVPLGNSDLFNLISTPICIHLGDSIEIKECFKLLHENFNKIDKDIFSEIEIKINLLKIIFAYLKNCPENRIELANTASSSFIENALKYINANISNHISVSELASEFHFHPTYFIKIFKSAVGMTPINYINNLKLEKIKQELLYTDNSISEIIDKYGMEYKNFIKIFKKQYCISPTFMRKNLK